MCRRCDTTYFIVEDLDDDSDDLVYRVHMDTLYGNFTMVGFTESDDAKRAAHLYIEYDYIDPSVKVYWHSGKGVVGVPLEGLEGKKCFGV